MEANTLFGEGGTKCGLSWISRLLMSPVKKAALKTSSALFKGYLLNQHPPTPPYKGGWNPKVMKIYLVREESTVVWEGEN